MSELLTDLWNVLPIITLFVGLVIGVFVGGAAYHGFIINRGGKTMFKSVDMGVKRFVTWYRKNKCFGRSRKLSDYRAVSRAEKLIYSGSLTSSNLTGTPLVRHGK